MKRVILAVFVALVVAMLVGAVSASHLPTTGTRLSMYRGNLVYRGNLDRPIHPNEITFSANSPFFVQHGWVTSWDASTAEQKQAFLSDNTRFDLYVDGVKQASKTDRDFSTYQGELFLAKTDLTNFPDGMTGTHLFRGEWWIDGLLIGEDPGESYLDLVSALQVTFV